MTLNEITPGQTVIWRVNGQVRRMLVQRVADVLTRPIGRTREVFGVYVTKTGVPSKWVGANSGGNYVTIFETDLISWHDNARSAP
jgi:hypothetical protein